MNYQFICPKCGKQKTISIPASEYTANGHFCDKCGAELKRDIKDFCTSSPRNIEGFFGTSKKT